MCLDVGEDFEIDIPGPRIWVNGPTFAINSGSYNGLATAEFKTRITAELAAAGLGREAINYKLRDWLFSRQRFWGEPFPILHELDSSGQPTGMIRPVPVAELPLDLPHLEDFKPHGRPEPPLGKSPDSWLYTVVDGRRCRRETNTMPQWAGSCWYYLRFIDPRNGEAFVDREKERAWMPVDLYVGGAEHAVLHLLYSRFWHKVLFDRGYVSTPEPFLKLVNQGMILGDMEFSAFTTATPPVGGWKGNAAPPEDSLVSIADAFETEEGSHVRRASREPLFPCKLDADSVEKQGEHFVLKARPEIRVDGRSYKMSKSRGNVVNPDQIVRDFGADSLRLYEMFMGPLEATKPWSMTGVSGVRKFLDRAWNLIIDMHAEDTRLHESVRDVSPTDEQDRLVHKTIKAVTDDLERMSFNTAIARLMEFVNFFTRQEIRPKGSMEKFVLLLSPYAPHAAEELWRQLGHAETLAYEPWPQYDPAKVVDDTVEIPVQIKGKVRTKIVVPAGLDQAQLETAARADEKVIQLLAGQQVVKTILVPGRLVNFVTK